MTEYKIMYGVVECTVPIPIVVEAGTPDETVCALIVEKLKHQLYIDDDNEDFSTGMITLSDFDKSLVSDEEYAALLGIMLDEKRDIVRYNLYSHKLRKGSRTE